MNADRVATDAIELLPVTGLERDQEHGGAAESSYALGPPHGAECEGNVLACSMNCSSPEYFSAVLILSQKLCNSCFIAIVEL